MSTYFECINDNGTLQINDFYETQGITRNGTIRACISNGKIYGLTLNDEENCMAFSVASGTLYVSPVTKYNGKKICYVASKEDVDIAFYAYSTAHNYVLKDSGCGLQIFNAKGQPIFDSMFSTLSIEGFYSNAYDFSGNYVNGVDDTFALITGTIMEGHGGERASTFWLIDHVAGCKEWSKTVRKGTVVRPYCTPWSTRLAAPYSSSDMNQLFICGFTFSENGTKISTDKKFSVYSVNTLLGDGNLIQLHRTLNRGIYVVTGIRSSQYLFDLLCPLS